MHATINTFKASNSRKTTRHEKLIFHHGNGPPHVAVPVKNYLENVRWKIQPHPPYSPDKAASEYHLFRSMQNHLSGILFTNVEGIKKWLDEKFFFEWHT